MTTKKEVYELKEGMTAKVEGGKLVIETPWTPKRGDFVTLDESWISVYSGGGESNRTISDFCGTWLNHKNFTDKEPSTDRARESIRPSTESEIAKFHELLAKSGKQWDYKQLKVVDLKWEPERGDVIRDTTGRFIFIFDRMNGGNYKAIGQLHYDSGRIEVDGCPGVCSEAIPTTREDRCAFF